MKEFLSREDHVFEVRNVETDAAALDELIEKGFRVVPVTFVGGTAVRGYDEAGIRQAIATASQS